MTSHANHGAIFLFANVFVPFVDYRELLVGLDDLPLEFLSQTQRPPFSGCKFAFKPVLNRSSGLGDP